MLIDKEKMHKLAKVAMFRIPSSQEEIILKRINELATETFQLESLKLEEEFFKNEFIGSINMREDKVIETVMDEMKENHLNENGYVEIRSKGV
jgi:Asp-tRNA(Asn)/Glu-tRNA(Gln) amidotransferase C subunit